MIALILAWAIAGDAWATEAVQRIGGPAHSIWIDSQIFECPDLTVLEQLGAGYIDDVEATRQNIINTWPENQP
jgi:hypothetical protein